MSARAGRARYPTALMVALALAGAGCEADEEHLDADPGPDGPGTIEVVGVDYAFEGVPESAAVGSGLTFRNDSDVEAHELVLVALPEGERRPVSEIVQLPPPESGPVLDNEVGVSVAAPEEEGRAVAGELTVDEPGRYALLCTMPIGADPDDVVAAASREGGPGELEDGPPHTDEGMYAELTVEE